MAIQDFYATAQKQEFARKFQFKVRSLGPFTEDDLLYIETAALPGKEITNVQVPYMGLDFNVPGTTKYTGSDSWSVTFRCDEGTNIRNKMEAWIAEVFNDETSTGKYGVPTEVATFDLLGKNLETLRRYQFIGLYPKTVGSLEYDIKDDGQVVTLECTFAYQFWRLVGV